MRLFADAEFTAFRDPQMKRLGFPYSPSAKMLSLGLVGEDGSELYLEVTDPAARREASEFVQTHVLPQFGLRPAAQVASSVQAGHAIADFLAGLPGGLVICADYTDDLRFLREALQEAGRLDELRGRLELEQVWSLVCAPNAEPLWDAAFERLERETGLLRHHALVDAMALKAVYLAIEA